MSGLSTAELRKIAADMKAAAFFIETVIHLQPKLLDATNTKNHLRLAEDLRSEAAALLP